MRLHDEVFWPSTCTLEDILEEAASRNVNYNKALHNAYKFYAAATLDILYGHPKDKSFINERVESIRDGFYLRYEGSALQSDGPAWWDGI